jgi:hypothetical protein
MPYPSPFDEIRILSIRTLPGPNYWSRKPITRLDLSIGAYEEISSADVPGFTAALQTALPGLIEHRCNLGERGGFIERLRRGTYAPHIIEHVGLELQTAIGHDVGFGRARGGDGPGEYTVVFAHDHSTVGRTAAALAVDLVRDAFARELSTAEHAITELERYAADVSTSVSPAGREILCGVTGGSERTLIAREMRRRGVPPHEEIADIAPVDILYAGLPYSRSRMAVILDALPMDVPVRYREGDRARQLVSVLADCVPKGGVVVVPAADRALVALVRDSGLRLAIFDVSGDVFQDDEVPDVCAAAYIRNETILISLGEAEFEAGRLGSSHPVGEVAGALAAHLAKDLVAGPAGADERAGAPLLR